ncbi:glycoside hydrolase, partial [Neoconidiobolus thromboides FSU 785]
VGYFSDWTLGQYPVSAIDFSKVTHINYAFALFTDNGFNPKIETENTLRDLVTKAHQTSTKVSISIGGWTGSKYFSPMAADINKRKQFVANTVAFVNKFNLDGIDIDWEYPGRNGAEGNIVSPQDTANFLLLLKELRTALGNKLITAAVRAQPFDGPNGPLNDVRAFVPLFDWLNLMCYDFNGTWETTTGPVGGLDYQPGKGAPFSVKQTVRDWSNAGFTYDKLVVGVPFYGFSAGVGVDMTNTDQYQKITNANSPGYSYNALITQKILKSPLEANDAAGWIRKFDSITQTPWLFNKNTKTFIAYDDIQSLKVKTDYVRCNGLRGAMLWAMDNDYQHQLL